MSTQRIYSVYKGEVGGKLVYIGTTIQEPAARFRWHKANGKPFSFTVLSQHANAQEMLDEEFRLIQLHRPKFNKITERKQNFNAVLSQVDVTSRKGDASWCQCCLKRRVSAGYSRCMWCGKSKL